MPLVNKHHTLLLFLLLLLSNFHFVFAQNALDVSNQAHKIIHFGVEDGLSQGSNYSILKDSRGFMWLTSYEGLNRFDGYNFKVYTEISNDTTSLKGSNTIGLVEDPYGNIWTGTESSLNRYLRQTDQFDFVQAENKEGQIVQSVHYPFYADSTEVWYINDQEGILAYNYITGKKKIITDNFLYTRSNFIINSTRRSKDGKIWIREENGLIQFDPKTKKTNWYFSSNPGNILGYPLKFVCFFEDKEEVIWLGHAKGLIRFEPQKNKYQEIDLSQYITNPIADIAQSKDGNLWLGTEQDGLFCYDRKKGIIKHYHSEGSSNDRLSNNSASTIYIDDQDLIWVNVDPEGINLLMPNLKPFKKYSTSFFEQKNFSSNGVRCFIETPDRNIWIGTQEDGLILFDPKEDKIIKHIPTNSNGFRTKTASHLLYDSQSRLWLGSYDGIYLSKDNGDHFQLIINRSKPEAMRTSNFIWNLLEMPDQGIIFSTDEGIYQIPANSLEPIAIDTLSDIVSGAIGLTSNNELLVTEHHNGFFVLNGKDWFSNKKDNKKRLVPHFLSKYNVKHFYLEEDKNLLWVATNTGLLKVKYQENWSSIEILKHYTRESGLPSHYVYGILPDSNNNLWLSTNRGLAAFDPKEESFSNFSVEDGLQGYEYNTNSFLKTKSGEFYFGGTNGFNRFYPEFKKNTIPPLLQIIDFQVEDQPVDLDGYIGEKTLINLTHDQNTFTFLFSAMDYLSNKKNNYRVKLKNFDKEWTDLKEVANIRYTKVPPGSYTLLAEAANNDGIWTSSPTKLQIEISAPWYKTWWAYLGYLMLLGFVLNQIYQIRSRRRKLKQQLILEKKEAERLKELDDIKTKLFTNITHEFRTPLTVMLGLTDEIERNPKIHFKKRTELIRKNGKMLLKLINQLLDLARLDAQKMQLNLVQDDVVTFLRILVDSFHSHALSQNIGLQFYSEEEELFMDFDPNFLQQILSNLLSNAFKFTPAYGKVLVVAKLVTIDHSNRLEIKIIDSGKGIDKDKLPFVFDRFYQADNSSTRQEQGSGIGLSLTKELIDLMDGQISVESQLKKGSTFTFQLPIKTRSKKINATLNSIDQNAFTRPLETTTMNLVSDSFEPNKLEDNTPKILIIEDNLDVIYYLQTCLESEWKIYTAKNGQDGINKAIEIIPDMIITDVMMPGVDGFEVLEKLKSEEKTSHIPILMLTAKSTNADKLNGLSKGADAYLIKPFDKEELLLRLDNFRTQQKRLQDFLLNQKDSNQPPTPEQVFLLKIDEIIEKHLDETDFNSTHLAREASLSRTQLHRKLKALTDQSTTTYIRAYRLKHARQLLLSSSLQVSEIAWKTGFSSLSWFDQAYHKAYKESPSQTRK